MTVRVCKILMVFLAGVLALMVGIDNIIDYDTNFAFVGHVMSMDSVFPNNTLMWRAMAQPEVHHAAYGLIIAFQLLSATLCIFGAMHLWTARGSSALQFNASKALAIAGLVCGLVLWFFGFLTVGAEWFKMWQSDNWNGQNSAFRFFACFALILLFLNQRDQDFD